MIQGMATPWLLSLTGALCASAVPLMVLMGSLLGAELAPSARWATLPIACMVIGTAAAVVPITRLMARFGRKPVFYLFIGVGSGSCLLAGEALARASFLLLCVSASGLGMSAAAFQQFRFAAMEKVPLDRAPTAAAVIMIGSILAAFLGPELALLGQNLSDVEYRGSFWLAAGVVACAGLFLAPYQGKTATAVARSQTGGRSVGNLLRDPTLLLALGSATIGYAVMSFVMTGTPISMHHHHGHSLADTKWVIQSHIAAMFLPSLLTVWLFRFVTVRQLMVAGLACYALTIVIGLRDASVLGFWGQLVMLGVGWNFLFVSGTALLPSAYREGEQYRAQALNDTVVFSTQAMASLSAGAAVSNLSWNGLLLLCLLPMAFMAGLLVWENRTRRRATVSALEGNQ